MDDIENLKLDSSNDTSSSKYLYMKAKLMSRNGLVINNIVSVKEIIMKSIGERFGQVGMSLPVDVLAYDKSSSEVVIRCSDKVFNRVSASLLFCCDYRSDSYYFKILKSSYSSLSLLADSRTFQHGSLQIMGNKKRKYDDT